MTAMKSRKPASKNVVAAKLAAVGVKTMADLDRWIQTQPRTDKWDRPYLMSRYGALKELVGENAADSMMNELAVRQCF